MLLSWRKRRRRDAGRRPEQEEEEEDRQAEENAEGFGVGGTEAWGRASPSSSVEDGGGEVLTVVEDSGGELFPRDRSSTVCFAVDDGGMQCSNVEGVGVDGGVAQ